MVVQGEEVAVAMGDEGWLGLGLPSLSLVAKYSCLLCWTPREKSSVEDEIKEKEEAIRQRSSEVQVRSHCLLSELVSVLYTVSDEKKRLLWAKNINDIVVTERPLLCSLV